MRPSRVKKGDDSPEARTNQLAENQKLDLKKEEKCNDKPTKTIIELNASILPCASLLVHHAHKEPVKD